MSTANTETSHSDLKIPNVITIEFKTTISWFSFKITSQSDHFIEWLKKNAHIHGRWQIRVGGFPAIRNDLKNGSFFIGSKDEEKNRTVNEADDDPSLIQKELTKAIQSAADAYLRFVEEENKRGKIKIYLPSKEINEIKRAAQRTLDDLSGRTIKRVDEGPCDDDSYPCQHSKCLLILNNDDTMKNPYTNGAQIAEYLRAMGQCTQHFEGYLDLPFFGLLE